MRADLQRICDDPQGLVQVPSQLLAVAEEAAIRGDAYRRGSIHPPAPRVGVGGGTCTYPTAPESWWRTLICRRGTSAPVLQAAARSGNQARLKVLSSRLDARQWLPLPSLSQLAARLCHKVSP